MIKKDEFDELEEKSLDFGGQSYKCKITGNVILDESYLNNNKDEFNIDRKLNIIIKRADGAEYNILAHYNYLDSKASGITPVINFDYFGISGKFYKPESLTAAINTILTQL